MITIFENIFSKSPHYIEIDKALDRIKQGASKRKCEEIRNCLDKEQSSELKKNLPSVCFSGVFDGSRSDDSIKEHSNYIILDFDNVKDVEFKKDELFKKKYIKACWVSPSGKGVKALAFIGSGEKHREHFQALMDIHTDIDKSGINLSRVCYESYDPLLLSKDTVEPFLKVKKIERVIETVKVDDSYKVFNNIVRWLSNKGDAFVSGERNVFIFKLASACCRFGIHESDCWSFSNMTFLRNDTSFTNREAENTIKNAYKRSGYLFGTASFDNDVLVDKTSLQEITIDASIYDMDIKPKDVIFGIDVKENALDIYRKGYESARSTFVEPLDIHFKWKRGELTLLSGIGNYGKSTYLKYLLLLQSISLGEKIAIFSPEECPAHEFYHDFVEMYFGCDCTPRNPNRPNEVKYQKVYDFISSHVFFIYPTNLAPSPDYIKERFLELIIKNNVTMCVIDPFNQLTNDYKSHGGRSDKYLETILADFQRFALLNNIFFTIIAHPHKMVKSSDGNYPCPDVFDIADGAMWNNKMDNILIYHLPFRQTDPTNTTCEHHSKKIRRRKIVGTVGSFTFNYVPFKRRFEFDGIDYLQKAIAKYEGDSTTQESISFDENYFNTTDEIPF